MRLMASTARRRALVRCKPLLVVTLAMALCAVPALADNIFEYIGVDDGAPVTGPFPASSLAQSQFLASAKNIGPINTITFETTPLGFQKEFIPAPGVTVDLDAPDLGPGYSGVSNFTFGNLNGFNVTPNGKN